LNLRATLFNYDLSNEPNFAGSISLDSIFKMENAKKVFSLSPTLKISYFIYIDPIKELALDGLTHRVLKLYYLAPRPPYPLYNVSKLALFLSLPVYRRSSEERGGWGRSQIIRSRKSLAPYKSFNTLLFDHSSLSRIKIIKILKICAFGT
jgi:hypothetical protein